MSEKTRTIYLHLVDVTKFERPFTLTERLASELGMAREAVKAGVERLAELGVVRRERMPAGSFSRQGPRTLYYLTGTPLADETTQDPVTAPEPRIDRTVGPLDRWRSLTGRLLGDPPVGRSALDEFMARRRRRACERTLALRIAMRVEKLRDREEADDAAASVASILGGSVVA